MNTEMDAIHSQKPLLRGHFHQGAFFVSIGASAMLVALSHGMTAVTANLIYGLSLCGLFGVSALYHRVQWNPESRARMRRLDHSAIFVLIAGSATPLIVLGLPGENGNGLLAILWIAAGLGVCKSLFWANAPKWLSAIIYVGVGWLAIPLIAPLNQFLGLTRVALIIAGGAVYSLGALVYALKRPNPSPRIFGYHEIFHILVVVAALLHFVVIASLVVL